MTEMPQNITKFLPNHFAVIKRIETLPQSTEILDLDESFDHNFIPLETSSPRDKSASFLPKSCFLDAVCNPMGKRKNELHCKTTSSKRKKTDDNITHLIDSSNFVESVNLTRWSAQEFEKCASDISLCSKKNSDKTVLSRSSPNSCLSSSKMDELRYKSVSVNKDFVKEDATCFKQLPRSSGSGFRFLTVDELLSALQHPHQILSEVPRGVKENCYFIINNEENMKRRCTIGRSIYWDDCGSWRSDGCTNTAYYFKSGDWKLKKVILKSGKFCIERQLNKKKNLYSFTAAA